ncbi:HNH endonuclease [Sphingomonas paucimobilis]|jgi:5-methylcytosine-specific restriction enzyme A|uniref:HNH endonuclease n=1 Tax=Sphingomonas paucimobilis TaxID=13689 RepID=UPI00203B5885|nr:HNH endonuclease signature motif containing protein [Sphingomonas paucimobilis]MCM3680248.1 HNH endonuclease [Sphingomonas paucimobilis]
MPSQPPRFVPKGTRSAPPVSGWRATSRGSRQSRGYGRAHDIMRAEVLREEPICRICLAMKPPRFSESTIADHIVPKAEGGGDERENYQGVCKPCHKVKTAAEAARARRA